MIDRSCAASMVAAQMVFEPWPCMVTAYGSTRCSVNVPGPMLTVPPSRAYVTAWLMGVAPPKQTVVVLASLVPHACPVLGAVPAELAATPSVPIATDPAANNPATARANPRVLIVPPLPRRTDHGALPRSVLAK